MFPDDTGSPTLASFVAFPFEMGHEISGVLLEPEFLAHHLSNAISGQFSLGGVQDVVIVEYMVRFSTLFEEVSFQGVPDIRVIVFRGYPIMAMVRLPTRVCSIQSLPCSMVNSVSHMSR